MEKKQTSNFGTIKNKILRTPMQIIQQSWTEYGLDIHLYRYLSMYYLFYQNKYEKL